MRWWRLSKPVYISLKKLKSLAGPMRGIRIVQEDPPIVRLSRGVSFAGRPVHEWHCYLKGKRCRDGRLIFTHWVVEEWHTSSPSTLGFGLFFPEAVEPFASSYQEKREFAEEMAEYLRELARMRKVMVKGVGWMWRDDYERVREWSRSGRAYVYRCRRCGHKAITNFEPKECTVCQAPVRPRQLTIT